MTGKDPNLGEMYRRASRETSPKHLDRRILAEAAPGRPWQPIALAATVLLSFAFIVNIGLIQPDAPVGTVGPTIGNNLKKEAANAAPSRAGSEVDARQTPPAEESAAFAKRSFAPRSDTKPASAESAADLARVMEALRDSDQGLGAAGALSQTATRSKQDQGARYCPEAVSASAGSWYHCILELREKNLDDQANFEQALLLSKFPEFEIR